MLGRAPVAKRLLEAGRHELAIVGVHELERRGRGDVVDRVPTEEREKRRVRSQDAALVVNDHRLGQHLEDRSELAHRS
jgi:hypothetical protein